MITLPFAEFPYFTEDVLLDNAPYRFRFLWNTRASRWTMSVYDLSDVPLVEGIAIALDQEMLGQYPDRGLPPGELWAVDGTSSLQDIARNDIALGNVQLVYVPQAEI